MALGDAAGDVDGPGEEEQEANFRMSNVMWTDTSAPRGLRSQRPLQNTLPVDGAVGAEQGDVETDDGE